MNPLLRVLDEDKFKFTNVNPGASIYFEYTELECCGLSIRITFNNDIGTDALNEKYKSRRGGEREDNIEVYEDWEKRGVITLEGVKHTENGSMAVGDFKTWLDAKI